MRNLHIHIYGYNNEHDVMVYTVVKDTQRYCGHPRHRFQTLWSVYTETQPWSYQTKTGLQCFQTSLSCTRWSRVNDRRNRSTSSVFKTKIHSCKRP